MRKFRAAIQPVSPLDTFIRTLLWSMEAASALEMIGLTKKAVSGRFDVVARYLAPPTTVVDEDALSPP